MELVVSRITQEALDIVGLELRAPGGARLPAFTPGAHIDLHLADGLRRQYSLTNDSREDDRYCLGVGLAAPSRGGSRHVHERLKKGDVVQISPPRSLFGIEPAAAEHLFIAGGIGITPILAMIRWCEANHRPWRLLYAVRSRARAAYLWDLAPHHGRVHLHLDEEQDGQPPDIAAWIAGGAGRHIYCCGPGGLMDAVARHAADAGLPADAVHFERFTAEPSLATAESRAFTVVLRRTKRDIEVPPHESVLAALERCGIELPFSCREGLCRTCETPVIEGAVDHRDHVLDAGERAANGSMIICVSRALGERIVLDL